MYLVAVGAVSGQKYLYIKIYLNLFLWYFKPAFQAEIIDILKRVSIIDQQINIANTSILFNLMTALSKCKVSKTVNREYTVSTLILF